MGEREPLHPFSSHWEDGDSPSGGRCQQLVHPPLHLPRNLNLDINTLCGYPIVKIEIWDSGQITTITWVSLHSFFCPISSNASLKTLVTPSQCGSGRRLGDVRGLGKRASNNLGSTRGQRRNYNRSTTLLTTRGVITNFALWFIWLFKELGIWAWSQMYVGPYGGVIMRWSQTMGWDTPHACSGPKKRFWRLEGHTYVPGPQV